jgi:hypothetical protein
MTWRQSNNHWSGGIAAHPASPRSTPPQKNSSAKIHYKISRLDFLYEDGIILKLLSFKGPNYQHQILIISVGAIEIHFEGKTPREVH